LFGGGTKPWKELGALTGNTKERIEGRVGGTSLERKKKNRHFTVPDAGNTPAAWEREGKTTGEKEKVCQKKNFPPPGLTDGITDGFRNRGKSIIKGPRGGQKK